MSKQIKTLRPCSASCKFFLCVHTQVNLCHHKHALKCEGKILAKADTFNDTKETVTKESINLKNKMKCFESDFATILNHALKAHKYWTAISQNCYLCETDIVK